VWSPESVLLRVEVPAADVELAADRLWQTGAVAIEERPSADGRRVVLLAGFADADLTAPIVALAGRWPASVTSAGSEDEWRDAWRRFAAPERVGRIVVQPAWVAPLPPREGDVVVVVDPGRAFGSGSHPSTRVVLAALDADPPVGAAVLDVGCGSGVLSIAAVLLGAAHAVGVDVDPEAVRATGDNAARNGVADRVTASLDHPADVPGRYPLVLCNIGVLAHVELAPALQQRVEPGGLVILSGLLVDKWDGSVCAFPGFTLVDVLTDDGWSAPILRAPT
jgi:ribosomal protein L11 methyltransferase